MENDGLANLAALAGALGVVLALVPRGRGALLAGFAVLAVAEAGLAAALVPEEDLRLLVESTAGLGLLLAAIAAVAVLAAALVRYPAATPVVLLAAAPFRLPVQLGGQEAFLLVPLYGVGAAAALALAWRLLRGFDPPGLPPLLSLPVAGLTALAAVSLLWSVDARAGTIALAFFWFPFAAALAVVARSPLAAWLPRALAATLVALATAFALVGLWQAESRVLFFAQDLEVANAYTTFFRVTSLFKDPSLYGRHLVLAIAVLLLAVWLERLRFAVALPFVAVLFAGLYFSYSQSSFIALFVVTFAVALALAGRRVRVALAACAVAAVVAAGGVAVAAVADGKTVKEATSGRSRLVRVTLDVIEQRPGAGVGIGGQPHASAELAGGAPKRNASHTTPLTVAAELGAAGVAAYLALLAAAAAALRAVTRQDRALGLTLGAVLLTLVVHSLFYSGFFEDPLVWGTLGLAAAKLARAAEPATVRFPSLGRALGRRTV